VNPSTVAYKVGRDQNALWNDIQLTARVHGSIRDVKTVVGGLPRVPTIKGWVDETDGAFWIEHGSLFEGGIHAGAHAFGLSLIPTLPRESRQALLSCFEFPTSKAEVLAKPENVFCLVRPYLGLACRVNEALCRADNLWNLPLTLEDFRASDLGHDVHQLAREMARGLATIHWHAGIDGMDIEFVLGGADGWDDEQAKLAGIEDDKPFPTPSTDAFELNVQSTVQHTTHASNAPSTRLYVLDLDKASSLSFDRPDVAIGRLVTAVTCNDP
jgi:hypothetical protein